MGSITESRSANEAIQLPVIDVSDPSPATGKSLLAAATKYGFLYVDTKGTGFTADIVDREFELSKQFFALNESEKRACQIGTTNRGWTGMHNEILDPKHQRKGDFKEAFNIGEFDDEGNPDQPMPDALSEHKAQLHRFEKLCKSTCVQVLDLLAMGLEIEEPKFFSSRHTKPSGCTTRMLHYPSIPADMDYQPEVDIRAGAHSDYGSCTLLFQRAGQPGLEIRTPEGTWAPVPVIPDGYQNTFPPILVNIADLLTYWTNGLLKSTVHRVIFPKDARRGGEDRYSIAYFCHPANHTELVAVPSKIVQAQKDIDENTEIGYGGGATKERAITASEHLMNRLEATYGYRMDPIKKHDPKEEAR